MLLGLVVTRVFKFPSWITPAICFNNTTALPLLLIQSLESTGILTSLLKSDSDTTSEAVKRAKSYFLVCAIVGNSLTFALGPKLLDAEESPDEVEEAKKDQPDGAENGRSCNDVEQGHGETGQADGQPDNDNASVNEQTSLLPDPVLRRGRQAGQEGYAKGKKYWDRFPSWIQKVLDFLYAFLNAPLIGAVIGVTLGLTPPLHKWFFNEQDSGGVLKAWLTTSIENIGQLFATLQVVVVGVKLSSSLRKMKRGEDSGEVPWLPATFIILIRFIVWPV